MTQSTQSPSALAQLAEAVETRTGLCARKNELLAELEKLQRIERAETRRQADIGEIEIDPRELLTALTPVNVSTDPTSVKHRIAEVKKLLAQIDQAIQRSDEPLRILEREASREIIRGAQGDRWRQAVRRLAKAVAEIAELDAAVKLEEDALVALLPDSWSLTRVRFPPGPVFKFEPGDLQNVCRLFAERVAEADRRHHN